ncbi:hypothetical protein FPV67DRAFT_1530599 [Lyophyllum atratum]|nr:hypothetical protein FPV67DRAFT_1530599 [Lyophyllum atratum]
MLKTADNPASHIPSEKATDKAPVLTLVLVDRAGEDYNYAVVAFPDTYKDAEAAALKTLGKFMQFSPEYIILRRSFKNRKGEWVWAEIPPEDWKAVVAHDCTEVGVFRGPQRLAYGW